MKQRNILFISCYLDGTLKGNETHVIKKYLADSNLSRDSVVILGNDYNAKVITHCLFKEDDSRFIPASINTNMVLNAMFPSPELISFFNEMNKTAEAKDSVTGLHEKTGGLRVIQARKYEINKLIPRLKTEHWQPIIVIANFVLVNHFLSLLYEEKIPDELPLVRPSEIILINENGIFTHKSCKLTFDYL